MHSSLVPAGIDLHPAGHVVVDATLPPEHSFSWLPSHQYPLAFPLQKPVGLHSSATPGGFDLHPAEHVVEDATLPPEHSFSLFPSHQ